MSGQRVDSTQQVEQFFYEYAACLDEQRFAEWPGYFDPENSVYEILSRENEDLGLPAPIMGCYSHGMIQDRVAMLIKGTLTYRQMYLHRQVTNVRLRHNNEIENQALAGLLVHQSDPEGVASLYMVARYRAELVNTADGILIRKMAVIVDSFGIDTMLAVPL